MSGGDYAGVVLPVEGGRPKVDELDPGVAHPTHRALAGRAGLGVPVRRHEQNVFRLEIRVREVVVVQELENKQTHVRTRTQARVHIIFNFVTIKIIIIIIPPPISYQLKRRSYDLNLIKRKKSLHQYEITKYAGIRWERFTDI